MINVLLFLLCLVVADAALVSANAKGSRPREFCVCGYNSRTECDAGGYEHTISDCYDESGRNCGYDDQVTGTCSRSIKPKPRFTRDRGNRLRRSP